MSVMSPCSTNERAKRGYVRQLEKEGSERETKGDATKTDLHPDLPPSDSKDRIDLLRERLGLQFLSVVGSDDSNEGEFLFGDL